MNTKLFSGRVDDYVKFRLDYPPELHAYLDGIIKKHHITKVADIGSGTGLLSRWFLERKLDVYGVEPNDEMRDACAQALNGFTNFHSIDGSAEHTTLDDNSMDLIAVGNAFHWFDQEPSKKEWQRILKPQGHVLIVRTDWKDFPHARMSEYNRIVNKYCTGRRGMVSDTDLENAAIKNFFRTFKTAIIASSEYEYTLEELIGRFLSTSYSPKPGHAQHDDALADLKKLFYSHQSQDRFLFGTLTIATFGMI